jgi:CubicO group peptidase (beta-lactamase class C family)
MVLRLLCVLALVAAAPCASAQPVVVQWGGWDFVPVPRDFDGDGRADFVVWSPRTGEWWSLSSATGQFRHVQWGTLGDVPVPADFTGDGRTDFAVWRPSSGAWFVLDGVTETPLPAVFWGQAGDQPVPGDYNGDGRIDYAVWRGGTGEWQVRDGASGAVRTVWWGWGPAGDVPVPGDYDGVPGDDFAVWHPGPIWWWTRWSTLGGTTNQPGPVQSWGAPGDTPISARFCSGTASLTFWRPSQGLFSTLGQASHQLGQAGDVAVPANFFGDGVEEYAVYRPTTGQWFVERAPCDHFEIARARIDRALSKVRGVAVAAVKDDDIVFAHGAGLANGWAPATPDTPWQVASISKLFVATAMLALADEGLVDLEASAGLNNPWNGAAPTVRDFASHTAGVERGCYGSTAGDPSPDLALGTACLWDSSRTQNWFQRLPGQAWTYANVGAAWVARWLEIRSGWDFDTFTRARIFGPLEMHHTAWFRSQLASPLLAEGYFEDRATPTNEGGVSPYPLGNLRASARDLAKFMIMWNGGGVAASGQRILQPSTAASALRQHRPIGPNGFFWWMNQTPGRTTWFHDGVLRGVCARLEIDPVKREGVVVLTNGVCELPGQPVARPEIASIQKQLFEILADP